MKEEQEFNVRFVKTVEKHRCVYDFTLTDYSNKERQEEAWMDIASEMGSPVADCKERWRNLRGSLTRHLKHLSDDRRRKPYYLTEYMQFIVPFTKTRSRAVLPFIQDNFDSSFPSSALDDDESLDIIQPRIVYSGKRSTSSDGGSSESNFKFKKPREETNDDPDLNFFSSLMPDVRCMNASQKRQLKIGVIKLIDGILA